MGGTHLKGQFTHKKNEFPWSLSKMSKLLFFFLMKVDGDQPETAMQLEPRKKKKKKKKG